MVGEEADKRYSWFHLKYFYGLIVLSFIVVATPMGAALFTGYEYVDKLTVQELHNIITLDQMKTLVP